MLVRYGRTFRERRSRNADGEIDVWVKFKELKRNQEPRDWLGIESMRREQLLRWFGNVERRKKEDWLKNITQMDVV